MTEIVVDASAAAAWLLPSQATIAAFQLSNNWGSHKGVAPYLFSIELTGVLLSAERRERAGPAATEARLSAFSKFEVLVEPPLNDADLDQVLQVARRSGSGYADAHYLHLALQTGGAVASRDRGMIGGALRLGLGVFDLRSPAPQ